jgi:hypothetical protein
VTAAAHKLARILYTLIKTQREYNPARVGNEVLRKARKERSLHRLAEQLGYTLTR